MVTDCCLSLLAATLYVQEPLARLSMATRVKVLRLCSSSNKSGVHWQGTLRLAVFASRGRVQHHICHPERSEGPMQRAAPICRPAHRPLCDAWASTRSECVEITLTPRGTRYSSHLLQKYYFNPRVKWRTQHEHIRKKRECVGHPAVLARCGRETTTNLSS